MAEISESSACVMVAPTGLFGIVDLICQGSQLVTIGKASKSVCRRILSNAR